MGQNNQNPYRKIAILSSVLSYLVGTPLVGLFFGNWLDQELATGPIFLILFMFVGFGVGTYGTILLIRQNTEDE